MQSVLYPFRLRDPLTGKRYRARWKATADEIANLGGEIDGPAEIRGDVWGGGFRPFGPLVAHAELMRIEEPAPEMAPTIDAGERLLVALFLRRLVTYYARQRRFAQMGGAAALLRTL